MKKLLLLLTICFAMSCSKTDIQTTEMVKQTETKNETLLAKKGFEIDTTFVIAETRSAMASFVAEVGTYYQTGDTYNDLKASLDPVNHLSNMTSKGDDLLQQAYQYLVNNTDEEDMNGAKLMIAFHQILERAYEMDVKDLEDVDFEEGSMWLFGLDENNLLMQPSLAGGCKWYQLGCHLSSIWNWLTSTANGGGTTNGQALLWVVSIAAGVIGILNAL